MALSDPRRPTVHNNKVIRLAGPVLLLSALVFAEVASATTILAVRTPTEIYVGVDSKVKITKPNGLLISQDRCKLVQIGNTFITAAGPYMAPGLNIGTSFEAAKAGGGGLNEIARRFANHYAASMVNAFEDVKKSSAVQYRQLTAYPVSVFFFGFDRNTPVAIKKTFAEDKVQTKTTNITISHNDCPPECNDLLVMFNGHPDAAKGLSLDFIKTQSPVEFIRERIGLSITINPSDSGPPIDILQLTKSGGKWIQNEKQCPAIQPY